ncbi:N-acetylmuramoyl-L-alanine amidase [Pueribacillus theae]|uniref:N-acetylmuramoyl-L-alanine amidase n=1 Tax=Pueribacillus theae TaxID=2171751 RepID=A0A2U1K1N7_9BACI|nr:N-acetylmuramoyl-L-alanine amidase [Pueribacillus theae]PWA11079.1 N-acetylmuramoyl-L-alanine amidase [Pueribacillus theae]
MKIIQAFIPKSNTFTRPGFSMKPEYITVHETDNPNVGANALAHARLQENGNRRQASWHFQVDDKPIIYQSIPTNEAAWAGGDGRNGTGNRKSVHIEICVNRDGDYGKAKIHAAWLVRYLMKEINIPISNVVQHNKWSGKNCPRNLRKGANWDEFIALVQGVKYSAPAKEKTKDTSTPKSSGLIRVGSKGSEVKSYQNRLKKMGYNPGKVDGIFGPNTEAALRLFQLDAGISVDGIIGPDTKKAFTTMVKYPGYLISVKKPLMKGKSVKIVQRKTGVLVDGLYGKNSELAVRKYQLKNKLQVDGIVGPKTWMKMFG